MGYEKARKSSHHNPQFTPEPKTVQPKPYSQEAANRQDTENQAMREYKHEATTLEIQAKYGTITPEGQERLTFLQAKVADYTQRKLDFANRIYQHMYNSSGGNSSVTPPQRNTTPLIQAKLTIGQPGDKYEQEADRVATQVVNSFHAPTTQREALPEEEDQLQMKPEIGSIQRQTMPEDEELQMKSSGAGMTAPQDLERSIQQAKGSGQPLADSIKQPMEQAFKADFSSVTIHTDTRSDQLNQSIQARAFTTGQDIFFRQGEYNPGSREGQELLAHELTHVVQQNGGAVQAKLEVVQRIPDNIVQKVFDPNVPTTYDDDGGHSYADHGSPTTPADHLTRLTTGSTPSGRISMPPNGKSSKFATDAMHLAAMTMAINDLNANKKNKAGGWKKGYTNQYTLAGVGITYELDASGTNLKHPPLSCNNFYVAWSNDGLGDNFKLITMYPKP